MANRDPRIDAYIEKSAPFAQPILRAIREAVHEACPDVTESMKWSMPAFDYEGPLCNMAAFKAHCTMAFWKGSILFPDGAKSGEAMGQMGRITSLDDLPPTKALVALVRKAAKLNTDGVKVEKPKGPAKAEVPTPDVLLKALAKNPAAKKVFDAFPPGQRKEYSMWIAEARTEPTRQKRVAQAIEWIGEGKQRNWKYMKK